MASQVEPEYESDPEELKRSLAARRREASDDDEDDADGDGEEVRFRRDEIESDQSEEEVGTVKYDNDENRSEDGEEEEGDDYGEDIVDGEKRSNMTKEAGEDAAGHVDGDEEKEKQSSTVPTGGAFYMHDDRFQEMSGGRSRGGGRRSWGSGDERKWGHDKYEEITTQETPYDKRTSRGRNRGRGRGRGRGQGRGYARGSSSNASSSNGQQIFVPKAVTREGGPRKNEIPHSKGNQAHYVQKKQLHNGSQNSHEKMSHLSSQRSSTAPTKTGNEGAHTKMSVIASSLSSASPPFYPSGSVGDSVQGVQVGMERLNTHESAAPSGKKYRNTKSDFSPVYTAQSFQSARQGRGAPATGNMFNPQSHSQANRFSSPRQLNGDSKSTDQSYSRPSGQGLEHQSPVIRSLSSTTPKTSSSRNLYPPGVLESASETGASCDNSNFPAFLPVMQFGGQHGGVPTFGMAFPGYVHSDNGVGTPEMTWMPVLTGPGGLGASYSPPYAAIDGSYKAHEPGLPSSVGSSRKVNSANNLIDVDNLIERPEVTEKWVPKQQKNNPSKQPRRYSEMSFSK